MYKKTNTFSIIIFQLHQVLSGEHRRSNVKHSAGGAGPRITFEIHNYHFTLSKVTTQQSLKSPVILFFIYYNCCGIVSLGRTRNKQHFKSRRTLTQRRSKVRLPRSLGHNRRRLVPLRKPKHSRCAERSGRCCSGCRPSSSARRSRRLHQTPDKRIGSPDTEGT